MLISVNGRRLDLDRNTFLARGGEGEIHIDPEFPRAKVIKLYHQPDARRDAKLRAMLSAPIHFPADAACPLALALDSRGRVVGFQMRQLNRRFVKAAELFSRDFCEAQRITTRDVVDVYARVAESLRSVHKNNLLIGDLNDGAFLFHRDDRSIAWVDVDSWRVEGHPCIVGTELYLCPALYGIDLSRADRFEAWHDWFSFAVLLFRSLLRKHPFKAGTHPVYRSVMERAAHGVTVLDSGVVFPPTGLRPEVLSDDLIDQLLKHLKGKVRGEFPLDVLRAYSNSLTGCASCGLWYPSMRKLCPGCQTKTTVDLSSKFELAAFDILHIRGRVLAVKVVPRELRIATEEGGKLCIYRGAPGHLERIESAISHSSSMRVGLIRDLVSIVDDSDADADLADLFLLRITPTTLDPVKAVTTTFMKGASAMSACSERFIYRTSQNMLLACEPFGLHDLLERPVCQVFENQCWFTCDPHASNGTEVLCGFNRDRSVTRWFVSTCAAGDTRFSTQELALSELTKGESLTDFAVYVRDSQCIIARRTRYRGKERSRIDVVDATCAQVIDSTTLDIAAHPRWDSVQGKACSGGIIMHPTDQGIVREDLASRTVRTLKDSQSLVSVDDTLIPYEGGILRVETQRVSLITNR